MDLPVLRSRRGDPPEPQAAEVGASDGRRTDEGAARGADARWVAVGSAPGTPERGAAKRSKSGLVVSFVATLASTWVLQFAGFMAVCTWFFAWMQDAFQFVPMREALLLCWFVASLGARLYLWSSGVVVDLEPQMRGRWNYRTYVMLMGSWIFVPMVVRDISSWMAP